MRGAIILTSADVAALDLTDIMTAQGIGLIFNAVRDDGIVLAVLPPFRKKFTLPTGRPVIALAEDREDGTYGPGAFHRASLRNALRSADNLVVHSTNAPATYLALALVAASGEHVFLVDTTPEHQSQWVETIKALAPGREVLLISEQPEGRVQ